MTKNTILEGRAALPAEQGGEELAGTARPAPSWTSGGNMVGEVSSSDTRAKMNFQRH